jgi:hypothetical protein
LSGGGFQSRKGRVHHTHWLRLLVLFGLLALFGFLTAERERRAEIARRRASSRR